MPPGKGPLRLPLCEREVYMQYIGVGGGVTLRASNHSSGDNPPGHCLPGAWTSHSRAHSGLKKLAFGTGCGTAVRLSSRTLSDSASNAVPEQAQARKAT